MNPSSWEQVDQVTHVVIDRAILHVCLQKETENLIMHKNMIKCRESKRQIKQQCSENLTSKILVKTVKRISRWDSSVCEVETQDEACRGGSDKTYVHAHACVHIIHFNPSPRLRFETCALSPHVTHQPLHSLYSATSITTNWFQPIGANHVHVFHHKPIPAYWPVKHQTVVLCLWDIKQPRVSFFIFDWQTWLP